MRAVSILSELNDVPEIIKFVPYMLDSSLKVEKHFPGLEDLGSSGYSMKDFAIDNQLVMKWFSGLQQKFYQWLLKHQ